MFEPRKTGNIKVNFSDWINRVQYGLVCAGIFPTSNYGHTLKKVDRASWKHFYDEGYTPFEAIQIDINES